MRYILTTLISLLISISSFAQSSPKIFYSDSAGGISSADLDGSNQVEILSPNIDSRIMSPEDLAVDPLNEKIYIADSVAKRIFRADFDGGNLEVLVDNTTEAPEGITVDAVRGVIYWTELGAGAGFRVLSVNSDGTSVQLLLSSGMPAPHGIAINPETSKLYYAASSEIYRSDKDGSNLEMIATPQSAFPDLRGIALDFANDKFYFVDHGDFSIFRADLDGSNLEKATGNGAFVDRAEYIEMNPANTQFFYTSSASTEPGVFEADLFGDNSPDKIVNMSTPTFREGVGMAIFPECEGSSPDTDGDGTVDCGDQCPSDANKAVAGQCGCGVTEDTTDTDGDGTFDCADVCDNDGTKTTNAGVCGCNMFLNPNNQMCQSRPAPDPSAPVLTPDTELEEPPDAVIVTRRVQLILQDFNGASLTRGARVGDPEINFARRLRVRYRVILRKTTGRRQVRRRTVRRNRVTFRRVRPGSYNARYRATITRGRGSNSRTVSRTNVSPPRTFNVG